MHGEVGFACNFHQYPTKTSYLLQVNTIYSLCFVFAAPACSGYIYGQLIFNSNYIYKGNVIATFKDNIKMSILLHLR